MSGMYVSLRRDRWTGQVVYEDASTPLGLARRTVQRVAVVLAAGVSVPQEISYRLSDTAGEIAGPGLTGSTVRERVDCEWAKVEAAMAAAGVVERDIEAALGRHSGDIVSLAGTVRVVVAERVRLALESAPRTKKQREAARKKKQRDGKRRDAQMEVQQCEAAQAAQLEAAQVAQREAAQVERGAQQQQPAVEAVDEAEMQPAGAVDTGGAQQQQPAMEAVVEAEMQPAGAVDTGGAQQQQPAVEAVVEAEMQPAGAVDTGGAQQQQPAVEAVVEAEMQPAGAVDTGGAQQQQPAVEAVVEAEMQPAGAVDTGGAQQQQPAMEAVVEAEMQPAGAVDTGGAQQQPAVEAAVAAEEQQELQGIWALVVRAANRYERDLTVKDCIVWCFDTWARRLLGIHSEWVERRPHYM